MTTFILAEKPSVAEAFAAALEVPRTQGYYRNDAYTVTNCLGHLLVLCDAQDYDESLKRWSLDPLPIIPEFRHKPNPATVKQLALVETLLQEPYGRYIIATDAGREGELIARLVLARCGVPAHAPLFRFWTSSALTKAVIQNGMAALKPAAHYDALYRAGLYRQYADWLIGINFSRFFSVTLGDRFIFGRVQTPVLALLAGRETAVREFKKSCFFRLKVACASGGGTFTAFLVNTADNGVNFDGRSVPEAALAALTNAPSAVQSVTTERKTRYPPRLLDLTELQKIANTALGFTAKQTLGLAQALYEKHQCLSYPRTASRYLARENRELFVRCLDALEIPHGDVDPANTNIFNNEAMEKNKEDHHALLLLAPLPDDATEEEKSVYAIVYKNMATVVKNPYVYDDIKILHAQGALAFVSTGVTVVDPGRTAGGDTDPGEEEEKEAEPSQALPALQEGDAITLSNPAVTEHERKPPKPFTEASLLAAMKRHGLGTVATRDTVIEGLILNGYCFRKAKRLVPADKAFFFLNAVNGLDNEALRGYLEVTATAEWERLLEDEPERFFDGITSFLSSTMDAVKKNSLERFRDKAGRCPRCGGDVLRGTNNWYCAKYKDGCTFSVGTTICNAAINEADVKALLEGKKTALKSMESKAGKPFKAYLTLDKDGNIAFEFKQEKKKE
jgi:DNA topoisomerase-3